ncbi:hypothetical protein RZN22_18830 [Bacillaceae bacterium S4-13-58]
MKKSIILTLITVVFLLIALAFVFIQNSSVSKALNTQGSILEEITIDDDTRLVLYEENDYIKVKGFEKSIYGWKEKGSSSFVVRNKDTAFTLNNIGTFKMDENGINILFGFVPSTVESLILKKENKEINIKVNAYYWYMLGDNKTMDFEEFRVIYKDGTHKEYPFD